MTLPFGIDISKHQGVNDYAKMKANTAFVFVKATESWGYTDPTFHTNWQGLAGHNRGAYSYVWLSDDPLRQANHLIDIVTQAGVDWKYDRLVLDLEKSGHGLSKAEVARRVLVMMEKIKEVTGRYPILYSRKYWVQDNMLLTDPRLISADWWLAYYRTALPYPLYTPEMPPPPLLPTGISKWLFHQTCEKGKGREVGVGSYYVDQNRFNGTREQLDAYFGLGEETPEPEPPVEVEDKLFDAKVVTKPGYRLRTRFTPGGNLRPVADWLQSQAIVPVYETSGTGWWRVGHETWASSEWMLRLDLPLPPPMSGNYAYYGGVYNQRDIRWAAHPLGTKSTVGAHGCLMTCASMVCNHFGHASNPLQLNQWLTDNEGYLDGNLFLWAAIGRLYPEMRFDGFVYNPTTVQIREAILGGTLPILHVDFDDSTPLIEMHWVLGIGVTTSDVIIADPWTGTMGRLSEMYPKSVIRYGSYRKIN